MRRFTALLAVLSAIGSTVACGAADDGAAEASAGKGQAGSYPLQLVNPRPYTVIVLASAGAAEVLVDTVPAADSTRVDLRVESDLVRLRAVDLEGNELGSGYLGVEGRSEDDEPADSIAPLRWELPPPP